MIGLPEILILLVILITFGGPAVAGFVIWKYVIKPTRDSAQPRKRA
jgi:hypothetical protein